jgi:FMN-dependent NADH-azoreductase
MSNLLFVTSSLMGENSKSRQVAAEYVDAYRTAHPGATVVERHLTPSNIPHLDLSTLGALGVAQDQRTVEQERAVDFADTIIAQVEAADTIVLAVPMYNFGIPSVLKSWFDHLARAGRTFRYTANGPQGLLKNKKAVVVLSRGGYYGEGTPTQAVNFQDPYIRTILGFVGITDVTFVAVEGQAIGPEAAAKGVEQARAEVAALQPQAIAA